MPRPEKVQAVAEIKERIEEAQAVFLAEYAGLSVNEQQELRRALRANGAEFKVVKMTLARRAADDLDIDSLDELLLGPTGLTFADGDPVSAAKVLKDFSKDHEVFVVKGGLLGAEFLTPERISDLADIEPRDVLLAKIAGAMKAPLANMAGLLAALPRNTASVLQQLLDQKEAAGDSADQPEADAEPSPSDAGDDADTAPEAQAEETAGADEAADEAPAEDAAAADDLSTEADAPAAEADVADETDEADETEPGSRATEEASAEAQADDTEDEDDESSADAESEEK